MFAAITMTSAQTALSLTYNDGVGNAEMPAPTRPVQEFYFRDRHRAFTPDGSVANLAGLSYWFEQQNPSAPFNFAITNRNLSASPFSDPQSNLTYPQNMTPANAKDLGGTTPDLSGDGAGTYLVANLTISIAASAAPGTYVIENTTTAASKQSVITDSNGDTFAIPQSTYTITVVPEPSSLGLLVLGLSTLALSAFRWPRISGYLK